MPSIHPCPRQLLPKGTALADLDPSIVYLPKPAGSYDKLDAVEAISGVSTDGDTTLMFETVFNPSSKPALSYAVYSGDEVSIEPFLIRGSNRVVPPGDPHGILERRAVLLPSEIAEYGSEAELDANICTHINRYADVAPFEAKLMGAFCKLSWTFDRFGAVPYLRFLGQWGSGKTRKLETLGHICYRGIPIGGSMSPAVVFRLMDRYHGTLLIDEADFKQSDLYTDITKILNEGYSKNMPAYRCDRDLEPIPYDPFGPKLLTTRKRFADAALESRCITVESQQKKIRDDIQCQLPASFYDEAQELRNKLLRWRFRNYHRIRPDETKLRALEPRLIQITAPLFAVTRNDPAFHDELLRFMDKGTLERRLESSEVFIAEAIRVLAKGKNLPLDLAVKDVAQRASELRLAQEPEAARITRSADGDEPAFYSAKRAGYLIRGLGFEAQHTRSGARFGVTETALAELAERFPMVEGPKPTRAVQVRNFYKEVRA